MENVELLATTGYLKPVMLCTTTDIPTVVQTVALHLIILHSKAELDQLAEGMKSLGVLGAIRKSTHLLQPYFTIGGDTKLTAGLSIKLAIRTCIE